MTSAKTDLSKYDNSWYSPGAGWLRRILWHYVNHIIFNNGLFPISSLKVLLLRMFGAKVGRGVNIKPSVNIKYPWLLKIGDFSWIGEGVWIDNLTDVEIGRNVCLSQGAMLLTGNHNFKKVAFDLMVEKIVLEDGVWVGANAIVGPGVTCRSHSVLTVNSVAASELPSYSICRGNPAVKIRDRIVEEESENP